MEIWVSDDESGSNVEEDEHEQQMTFIYRKPKPSF